MEYGWQPGGVIVADGVEVARADRSWLRERAEVSVDGGVWTFEAVGSWFGRRRLVAVLDGVERISAEATGFWQTTWTVSGEDAQLTLSPAGIFTNRMVLRQAGLEVGGVRPSHLFTNRPELTSTVPLAPALASFVLWVAFVELDRRSREASSAAT